MAGVRRPLQPGFASSQGPSKRPRGHVEMPPVPPMAPQAAAENVFEVRFSHPEEATAALNFHGDSIQGIPMGVKLDETSKDKTKVIVEGLPAGMDCELIKAHFAGAGGVLFAGPPKRSLVGRSGGGGGLGAGVGEVRYETAEEALQAAALLDGSMIDGCTISAIIDQSSKDGSKLILTGLPGTLEWQELKDHCAQAGQVAFVDVKRNPHGAVGLEGEVRYDDPQHTQTALQTLNGSILGGAQITVQVDPHSKDRTRLLVSGFPPSIQWQELKDHFSPVGRVAFAQVKSPDGGYQVPHGQSMWPPQFIPWGARPPAPPMAPMYGKAYGKAMQGNYRFGSQPLWDQWDRPYAPFVPWGGGCGQRGCMSGGKGGYRGPPSIAGTCSGEVRFDTPMIASMAINKLNGSMMHGSRLTVSPDGSSQDGSKVVVQGIPLGCQWQELKDHFGVVGRVAFASVVGPGEVRMETPREADHALSMLNGCEVMGSQISVTKDMSSKDGTRLLVHNLPSSVNWQQIKDLFGQAGTVAFATRHEGKK